MLEVKVEDDETTYLQTLQGDIFDMDGNYKFSNGQIYQSKKHSQASPHEEKKEETQEKRILRMHEEYKRKKQEFVQNEKLLLEKINELR